MPDTTTAVLALIKPEVGASRDSWGSKTNLNWDTLDQFVSQAMPIGAILDFAGPNAPSGWLICDGRWLSRTTYSDLFAVIGTTWGAGDGSTTFGLPFTNGRALVGPGSMTDQAGYSYSFPFGNAQGYVLNFITQAHLPAYNLVSDFQGTHSHGGASQAAGAGTYGTDAQGNHTHTNNTAFAGGHTHTASTDFQGEHTHQYLQAQAGGGSLAAGGSAGNVAVQTATSNAGAANHQHNVTIGTIGDHQHGIQIDGNHAHNVTISAHTHAIIADGNHAHNVNLGGGGNPFEVMSPILVVTKIIYAGQQASTRAALDAAPASLAATDSTDEMAAIREELAALRALFAPAARRVPTTPLRGMN